MKKERKVYSKDAATFGKIIDAALKKGATPAQAIAMGVRKTTDAVAKMTVKSALAAHKYHEADEDAYERGGHRVFVSGSNWSHTGPRYIHTGESTEGRGGVKLHAHLSKVHAPKPKK